jgi:hypothetical protein
VARPSTPDQRREVRRRVFAQLQDGPLTRAQLLVGCPEGTVDKDVQTALMAMSRSGLVCNTRVREGYNGPTVYELWEHVVARMRERSAGRQPMGVKSHGADRARVIA